MSGDDRRLLAARRVFETEAVQSAVVRPDVHAPVRDGESGEVMERRDLFAARVQLVAGLAIEDVQRGVRRLLSVSCRSPMTVNPFY
jgi:hypothetical protein